MKKSKEDGGNNIQLYSPTMESGAYEAISIEQDLRKALERDEIVVYYQPKVDVESCVVVGMEALVRWKHATKGIISPVKFIPLAEETGLIVQIGEKVLEDACLQTKKWLDKGFFSTGRIGQPLGAPVCTVRSPGASRGYSERDRPAPGIS